MRCAPYLIFVKKKGTVLKKVRHRRLWRLWQILAMVRPLFDKKGKSWESLESNFVPRRSTRRSTTGCRNIPSQISRFSFSSYLLQLFSRFSFFSYLLQLFSRFSQILDKKTSQLLDKKTSQELRMLFRSLFCLCLCLSKVSQKSLKSLSKVFY